LNLKKFLGLIIGAVILLSAASPAAAESFITGADLTVFVPITESVASKNVGIPDNADFEVVSVMWKDMDDNKLLSDGDTFVAGHLYMVGISLRSLNGKVFSEERTNLTVNGKATEWSVESANGVTGEVALVYHTFSRPSVDFVANLALSDVDAPVIGEGPDWDISCKWDGVTVTAVGWQCVENNNTVFSYSDQSVKDEYEFKAGCTYKLAVAVEVKDGYELYGFFSATVNGEQAKGTWNLEGKSAVVEYTFPTLPKDDRIPGDVNGDTKVNLADASLIMKHIAKWNVALNPLAADVTGDLKINLSDVSAVMKYIARWDIELK